MGKGTDKLYITHSEWSNDFGGMSFGGVKARVGKEAFRRLPFYCCALSLQPVELAYCTDKGIVFDLENIVPYMKKYGANPVTGEKLEAKNLFKLNFHKNNEGKYCCPVTLKVFTDHTHIVAIKPSGNVFAYDTVERLNVKANIWRDLVTDQPFTKPDIITIQDPHNLNKQNLETFHHLQNNLKALEAKAKDSNIKLSSSAKKILAEAAKKTEPIFETTTLKPVGKDVPTASNKAYNSASFSTGRASASLTSTSMTPVTLNATATVSDQEIMFKHIKTKGYVKLTTNLGEINLELYCAAAPRTCYNFIMLAKSGYYDHVAFHRSIKNFMIQGGDPTGSGKGGESYWKKDFPDEIRTNLSHDARGILAMANRGKHTNSSQFYITYRPCTHLDTKHTIFGKVVGGMSTLDHMERTPTDPNSDKPLQPIKILKVDLFTDPYQEYQDRMQRKQQYKEQEQLNRINGIVKEEDVTTYFGNKLQGKIPTNQTEVGKYLKRELKGRDLDPQAEERDWTKEPNPKKPNLTPSKFGNFEGW